MASSNFSPTMLVKSVTETEDGDLHVEVYGVPFGGPEYLGGKDFDGEYFDKSTDIGPLKTVLSYFDHGKNPYFGTNPIGLAEKMGMDEEGWIYRVIVDRHYQYKNLLKKLADAHVLSASSTPHQNTARKDENGHWKTWHVTEVALTPTPANPLATSIMQKTLGEEFDMANKSAEEKAVVTPAVETPVVEPIVEKEKQETPAESTSEQIEKAFQAVEKEAGPAEEVVTLNKQTFEKMVADLASVQASQAKLEKGIGDIQTALPTLGLMIAKSLRGQVAEEAQKSQPEKVAEKMMNDRRQPNAKLPQNAPGNN